MAFTLALVALIGLSLTNLQPASASYFGGNGGGYNPNPNPNPYPNPGPFVPPPPPVTGGELSDEQVRTFLASSPAAQRLVEMARRNNLYSGAAAVPCECTMQMTCMAEDVDFTGADITFTLPTGYTPADCQVIHPTDFKKTQCSAMSDGMTCTDVKTCGAAPASVCKAGGIMPVWVVAICQTFPPFKLEATSGMEMVPTNCCCTQS